MTYHSRKYFSRSSHTNYSKRTLIWNSSLFQKSNFYRLLLDFLSLKPHSNTWTRQVLTTYRNLPSQSLRSLTLEYLCTISLCGINHMSSWQPHRRKSKAYILSFFFLITITLAFISHLCKTQSTTKHHLPFQMEYMAQLSS